MRAATRTEAGAQRRPVAPSRRAWWLEHDRLLAVSIALVFAFASYGAFRYPAHHDLSWYQHAAARWLDGGEPYVDFIDMSPPLSWSCISSPSWYPASPAYGA